MGDYISREAAKEELCRDCEACGGDKGACAEYRFIQTLPAADVRPVARGRWIDRDDKYYGWNMWACSACGEEFVLTEGTPDMNEYHFCPNCGADMREGAAEGGNMSILIKGMEMPDRCSRCAAAFPDGVGWSCPLIKGRPNIDNQNGRRKDCPLVEIPPHGRLIDADALREDWLENGQNEYVYDTNAFLDSLDNAPTIIPAEEGEG